jgi:hypothetical protein
MATTVITGRDVSFTIGGNSYDAQATNAVLTGTTDRQTYQTLDGKAYKVVDNDFIFTVDMLADWGVTGSLCEGIWNATEATPDSGINVAFTAATGAAFAFQILPNWPTAGGSGVDAQTVSYTFQVIGVPAETF